MNRPGDQGSKAESPPGATLGTIVVLNGVPRSGKSSTARELQAASSAPWVNLGVDSTMASMPVSLLPGIGLRPGGERPDLEGFVAARILAHIATVQPEALDRHRVAP